VANAYYVPVPAKKTSGDPEEEIPNADPETDDEEIQTM
jgi:hypothetical protein